MAALLASARDQLVREGAAGLSLRAVARELGVASSAVYRYVPSRDALLTLLIVEAYDEVGDVVEAAAAQARAAGATPAATWLAVARAFRGWAVAQPQSFELLYGTPVRGYAAPEDTVAPAMRLWGVIVSVLVEAMGDGSLRPGAAPVDPSGLVTDAVWGFAGTSGPDAVPPEHAQAVVRSMSLFAVLVGAVTAELFGHLRGVTDDFARLFDVTVATASAGIGLHVDLGRA